MNGEKHPGRFPEFLSRLHDGELDAGERAHFEAHRAHCAECRRAAREFEDALALFRSTRSKPAQPDLAARILRKIQTSSHARPPFSRRFRMDLGWAALVLTGIFALLLTTPIAIRREEPPIVVSLPTPEAALPSPDRAAPAAPQTVPETDRPLRDNRARPDRPASSTAPKQSSELGRAQEPSAPPPAVASERKEETRDSRAAASEARPALAAEVGRAGGASEDSSAAAAAPALVLRLSIEAIDGFGGAPPLLSENRVALPVSFRGHGFILHVDLQGKVTEVGPGPSLGSVATVGSTTPAHAELSNLRFKPGNRPRRLLVRFE